MGDRLYGPATSHTSGPHTVHPATSFDNALCQNPLTHPHNPSVFPLAGAALAHALAQIRPSYGTRTHAPVPVAYAATRKHNLCAFPPAHPGCLHPRGPNANASHKSLSPDGAHPPQPPSPPKTRAHLPLARQRPQPNPPSPTPTTRACSHGQAPLSHMLLHALRMPGRKDGTPNHAGSRSIRRVQCAGTRATACTRFARSFQPSPPDACILAVQPASRPPACMHPRDEEEKKRLVHATSHRSGPHTVHPRQFPLRMQLAKRRP